jgi:hypothetical protein
VPGLLERELTPSNAYIGQVPTTAVAREIADITPRTGERIIGREMVPARIVSETIPTIAPIAVLNIRSAEPTLLFTTILATSTGK